MSKKDEKEKCCLSRWHLTFENLVKVMIYISLKRGSQLWLRNVYKPPPGILL